MVVVEEHLAALLSHPLHHPRHPGPRQQLVEAQTLLLPAARLHVVKVEVLLSAEEEEEEEVVVEDKEGQEQVEQEEHLQKALRPPKQRS